MSEEQPKYEVEVARPNLIALALEKGAGIEQLERLMALQERHEANEAKKAYVVAMAAFKANPPRIEKTKTVSFSGTSYKHALLADAAQQINEGLSRHGLSAGWTTKQEGDNITVTCTITHVLGHSEGTSLSAAPDKSGAKNAIQAIGSTVSYLERYTLLALTGLATHDMDNDGGKAATPITDGQVKILEKMLTDTSTDKARFMKHFEVETLDDLTADQYKSARALLAAKKGGN